ncbi:MAG: hypothetical protein KIH64_014380 [Mycobacterium sp.]|nr:hypothetical protein [Mycobacterium sp.]
MSKMLAGGFLTELLAETLGLMMGWRWALPVGGIALGLFAFQMTGRLARTGDDGSAAALSNDAMESLQRWKAQTEELIRWSEGTRGEWDRHLRPKLARDFMLATKQKEPDAVASSGRFLFGEDLWLWVDPDNVVAARRNEPGPGRDALDQILQRLEQA